MAMNIKMVSVILAAELSNVENIRHILMIKAMKFIWDIA